MRSVLVHADCFDVFPYIADKSVDMICCDLPYGTTACAWDVIIPFDKLWNEYKRIIKDKGVIVLFGSEPFSSLLRTSNLDWYKYDWIWEKNNSGNFQLVNYQPLKIHEDVVVFGKGACRYYPIKRKGVYRAKGGMKTENGAYGGAESNVTFNDEYYPESIIDFSGAGMRSDRIHPTEKPIDLMRYMIQTYTQEGEIVFDGYMGSGTTAHACITEKRNYIGSEMNEQFYKLLNERLEREYSQPKLF